MKEHRQKFYAQSYMMFLGLVSAYKTWNSKGYNLFATSRRDFQNHSKFYLTGASSSPSVP
jgi:hypothetical protein